MNRSEGAFYIYATTVAANYVQGKKLDAGASCELIADAFAAADSFFAYEATGACMTKDERDALMAAVKDNPDLAAKLKERGIILT